MRRVDDHEPYLRAKVGELLDAVADRGECDLVADIATPLPMYMIGKLMGLPEADHDQLLHWSDLFAAGDEELVPQIEQAVDGVERLHPRPRRAGCAAGATTT